MAPSGRSEHGFGRRAASALAGLAYPAALLLLGTFFLGGRIGFWSDDYWHNLRNPATGALPALTFHGLTMDRGFFLRPLFYLVVPAATTLSWKAQWPAHLALTLSHALVVFLLWRLLRALGVSRRASMAAALLFMVYPGHFEAVFWTAALPTSIASAMMLRLMLVTVRYARRERPFVGAWRGWWAVCAMPLLAFEICCLNEQPAMGVLALPLVYWAACREGRDGEHTRLTEWRRALTPAFLCGVAVLVYAAVVVLEPNKPAGSRGSAEQFVTLAHLPARAIYFGDVLWRRLVLYNFWRGALEIGVEQWRAAAWGGVVAAGLIAVQSALWVWRWAREDREPRPEAPRGLMRIAIAGATVFLTGWLPILMMAVYEPDSRTRYWPAAGLALIVGAVLTAAERRMGNVGRWISGTVIAAVLVVFATMQIGIQSAFRERWRLDGAQGAELRALVPNPVPYTFFVPLSIEGTGIRTGSPVFDAEFRSVWEFPWTTWKFIESAYRRDDVRVGYWRHWTPGNPVAGAGDAGLLYVDSLGPRFPVERGLGWRVPWARCVPFVVDREGHVRLVTAIRAAGPGTEEVVEFPIPQAAGRPPLVVPLPRR